MLCHSNYTIYTRPVYVCFGYQLTVFALANWITSCYWNCHTVCIVGLIDTQNLENSGFCGSSICATGWNDDAVEVKAQCVPFAIVDSSYS